VEAALAVWLAAAVARAAQPAAALAASPVDAAALRAETEVATCSSCRRHGDRRSSGRALQRYSSPAPDFVYDVAFKRSYASRIKRP
jgi:hypothetical protein